MYIDAHNESLKFKNAANFVMEKLCVCIDETGAAKILFGKRLYTGKLITAKLRQ